MSNGMWKKIQILNLHFMSSVGFQISKIYIPYGLQFLDFVIVLHLVLKNKESWKIWLDGFYSLVDKVLDF